MTPRTLTEIPAEVAWIVKRIREHSYGGYFEDAAKAIESLAGQVAGLIEKDAKWQLCYEGAVERGDKWMADCRATEAQLAAKDEEIKALRASLDECEADLASECAMRKGLK